MPCIDEKFLLDLKDNYKSYPVFIETGTLHGDTILGVEKLFRELHTIEIKKEFYDNVKNKYKGDKIKFHLGDSSIVLIDLLPKIKEKSIIFLDGHWSYGDTGKGVKDCPLYEEISAINKLLVNEAIIIIDDVRLFGRGPNKGNEYVNWEEISVEILLNLLSNRIDKVYYLPSEYYKFDRMVIHITKS